LKRDIYKNWDWKRGIQEKLPFEEGKITKKEPTLKSGKFPWQP